MEDRVPFPFLLEGGDSQPVEELLLPLKVCLEGADEQALADKNNRLRLYFKQMAASPEVAVNQEYFLG